MASMKTFVCGLALLAATIPAAAQMAPNAADPTISLLSSTEIASQARVLMDKAALSPTGVASVTLQTYPGHSVMLVARVKTGPSEVHANWNDVMFVLDGEATEVTGGKIVGGTLDVVTGETRGAGIEGGNRTRVAKGDVVHIPPNTPHWAVLAPGKTMLMCVVKVAANPSK
jgi:mannose-6-phosphate isomerase-like protein (cupin superfamily)